MIKRPTDEINKYKNEFPLKSEQIDEYLKQILNDSLRIINDDNTINKEYRVTDCNKNICQSAIVLRELLIYASPDDINDVKKDKMFQILTDYGLMFEGDINRVFDSIDMVKELTDVDLISLKQSDVLKYNVFDDDEKVMLMEKIIELLLVIYYTGYEITDDYDEIMYKSESKIFNFTVNMKELKQILFKARDSGGNLDFSGFVCDTTLLNVVEDFIKTKNDIEFIKDDNVEEFNIICDELFDECINNFGLWRLELY